MKTITALALAALLLLLVSAPSVKDVWQQRQLPAAHDIPATWWDLF